jgi:hypothetical protein
VRNNVQVGDVCNKGHVIEGTNILKRADRPNVSCRECTLILKRTYAKSAKGKVAEAKKKTDSQRLSKNARVRDVYAAKKEGIKLPVAPKQIGSYAGLSYLKMGKRAQDASAVLENQFIETRSKCFDKPEKYIDYDEENPPTNDEAYELCNGCPMLVSCGRFANALRPPIGVWAGQRWESGKVVKNDKEIK